MLSTIIMCHKIIYLDHLAFILTASQGRGYAHVFVFLSWAAHDTAYGLKESKVGREGGRANLNLISAICS
jgi:hypothetical protein